MIAIDETRVRIAQLRPRPETALALMYVRIGDGVVEARSACPNATVDWNEAFFWSLGGCDLRQDLVTSLHRPRLRIVNEHAVD